METTTFDLQDTGAQEGPVGRTVISQTQAARLRKISRQRINQLVNAKRLTVPVDEYGVEIRGGVYLDEVLSLTEGPKGRPRLSSEERTVRRLDEYMVGDLVHWEHVPRDGYGYKVSIAGTVVKVGAKKLKLKFQTASGESLTAWVFRDVCQLAGRVAHGTDGAVENPVE